MILKRPTLGSWCGFAFIFTAVCLFSVTAQAAFLYKSYIVRKDRGKDILCDPYIVQKDDYVLKIFRQRGEISHVNFPTFLRIFSRINPHINDIDKILPGQHIFIPLKILSPNSLEGQDVGVVTIPFVTISKISDILKENSTVHKVARGDTVSELLSTHFNPHNAKSYDQGLRVFKAMNPHIKDVNRIFVGQDIHIPQGALRNQPWYESLFDASGNLVKTLNTDSSKTPKATALPGEEKSSPIPIASSSLEQAAQVLEAKLFQKGVYYFPRKGKNDFQLDLTRFPVLELTPQKRILVLPPAENKKQISEANLAAIRKYWKNLTLLRLPSDAKIETVLSSVINTTGFHHSSGKHVFNDQGVLITVQSQWMVSQPGKKKNIGITVLKTGEEKTPHTILDYLAGRGVVLKELTYESETTPQKSMPEDDQEGVPIIDVSTDSKSLVQHICDALNLNYSQDVSITFPYAGAQIQAVSNLISQPNGEASLIDFGDLYGDAVPAIEKTGLKVVQIRNETGIDGLISKIISAAGMTCNQNPTFSVARRHGSYNTSIMVPGYLAQANEKPVALLATVPIHSKLLRFFLDEQIKVIGLSGIRSKADMEPATL